RRHALVLCCVPTTELSPDSPTRRSSDLIVYKQLGKWESRDFIAAAKYLAQKPYVDDNNMAIMGTSYGAYMTTYCMLAHPGVFKRSEEHTPELQSRFDTGSRLLL